MDWDISYRIMKKWLPLGKLGCSRIVYRWKLPQSFVRYILWAWYLHEEVIGVLEGCVGIRKWEVMREWTSCCGGWENSCQCMLALLCGEGLETSWVWTVQHGCRYVPYVHQVLETLLVGITKVSERKVQTLLQRLNVKQKRKWSQWLSPDYIFDYPQQSYTELKTSTWKLNFICVIEVSLLHKNINLIPKKITVPLLFTCGSSVMLPLSCVSCVSSISRTCPNGESGHYGLLWRGKKPWFRWRGSLGLKAHPTAPSSISGKTPLEGKVDCKESKGMKGNRGTLRRELVIKSREETNDLTTKTLKLCI